MALHRLEGDPGFVAAEASSMSAAASAILTAASQLRDLANPDRTISLAVDAYRTNVSELETVVTKAHVRYSATGEALATYARALEEAQRESEEAARAAASTDVGGARLAAVAAAADELNPVGALVRSPAEQAAANARSANARAALAAEEAALAAAEARWHAADQQLKAAAAAAMAVIDQSIDAVKDFNDGFWDDLDGFVKSVVDPAFEWFKTNIVPLLLEFLPQVTTFLDALGTLCDLLQLLVAALGLVLAPITLGASLGIAATVLTVLKVGSLLTKGISLLLKHLQFALGGMSETELAKQQLLFALEGTLLLVPGGALAAKGLGTVGLNGDGAKLAGDALFDGSAQAFTGTGQQVFKLNESDAVDPDQPALYESLYYGITGGISDMTNQDVAPVAGDAGQLDMSMVLQRWESFDSAAGSVVTPALVCR